MWREGGEKERARKRERRGEEDGRVEVGSRSGSDLL